jgi:periplasmic divalent cation tolerance protein
VTEAIVVQCTASSKDEARTIARALLDAKLAACASIVGEVESHYWWRGALEQAGETLLVIKTTRERFDAVRRTILEHHSYEVPEIVALPVLAGHQPYLDWITESVRAGEAES